MRRKPWKESDVTTTRERMAHATRGYAPHEHRPLAGYLTAMTAFAGLAASLVAAGRLTGRRVPDRPAAADVVLVSIATHKLSRLLAKDAVASPLRAPFATYQGPGGPGEVMEAPRPGAFRHAAGELLICPFCLTQWVATAGVLGYALYPRATRWVTAGMTAVAAADAMHYGYAKLQQSAG